MLVRHNHLDPLVLFVHHHFGNLGWCERIDDKCRLVTAPLNDVDLFALQLGYHRLHAATAHTNTGTNRINRAVIGDHGHLCPAAGITGYGANFDHTVVNFWHFLGEQFGHEAAVSAAKQNLWSLRFTTHVVDVATNPITQVEVFPWDRLIASHNAFATPQIDNRVAVLDPLDHAVDDFADPILELLVLTLALRLADLTGHDLAGHLRLNPTKLKGRENLFIGLAQHGILVVKQGDG